MKYYWCRTFLYAHGWRLGAGWELRHCFYPNQTRGVALPENFIQDSVYWQSYIRIWQIISIAQNHLFGPKSSLWLLTVITWSNFLLSNLIQAAVLILQLKTVFERKINFLHSNLIQMVVLICYLEQCLQENFGQPYQQLCRDHNWEAPCKTLPRGGAAPSGSG